jgi:hypothetical protein
MLATIAAFVLYPMSLAPAGPATNGGLIGIVSILCAVLFSWLAFALNTSHPRLRIAVQLPLTALITYLAINEAVTQYLLGPEHWLWL